MHAWNWIYPEVVVGFGSMSNGGRVSCLHFWGDYVLRSNGGQVLAVIEAKRCTPNWAWTLSQGIAQCVWQLATLKESQKCLGLKKCQRICLFGKVFSLLFLCEKDDEVQAEDAETDEFCFDIRKMIKFYDHPAWCVSKGSCCFPRVGKVDL